MWVLSSFLFMRTDHEKRKYLRPNWQPSDPAKNGNVIAPFPSILYNRALECCITAVQLFYCGRCTFVAQYRWLNLFSQSYLYRYVSVIFLVGGQEIIECEQFSVVILATL